MTWKVGHKNWNQKVVRNISAFEGQNLDLSATFFSHCKLKITYKTLHKPFTKTNCLRLHDYLDMRSVIEVLSTRTTNNIDRSQKLAVTVCFQFFYNIVFINSLSCSSCRLTFCFDCCLSSEFHMFLDDSYDLWRL